MKWTWMLRTPLPREVPERSSAKCSWDRWAPDNPSSYSFMVPSLRAKQSAGRPTSENNGTSRSKEKRHSQQWILFHGLLFRRPVNRARHVTHPWSVRWPHASHVCECLQAHGWRETRCRRARARLGMAWVSEIFAQKWQEAACVALKRAVARQLDFPRGKSSWSSCRQRTRRRSNPARGQKN